MVSIYFWLRLLLLYFFQEIGKKGGYVEARKKSEKEWRKWDWREEIRIQENFRGKEKLVPANIF